MIGAATGPLRRLLACALFPLALLAATPAPPAAVPGWPPGDHVEALAGTWSCRTVEGVIVHASGSRDGDTLTVHNEVTRAGKTSSYEDVYMFDPPLARWHVQTGLGGFGGGAAPWTDESWTVEGENGDRVAVRVTHELLPGGDFRRTFAYDNGNGGWFPYSVERCTRGSTPPAADACIAKFYPATTLEAGTQDAFGSTSLGGGTVYVVVSLDAGSRIVATRVQSSPNPQLNQLALAQTRRSRFRTAIVNCKPVAADYIFGVTFL
jgi:hypothetical protein